MYSDCAMPDDPLEYLAERAAILQFEAGLSRPDADYFAVVLMRRYCAQNGIEEPRGHWSTSMPRSEWSDAEGKAVFRREPYLPPQFQGKERE
jgi:hypothetical protein